MRKETASDKKHVNEQPVNRVKGQRQRRMCHTKKRKNECNSYNIGK